MRRIALILLTAFCAQAQQVITTFAGTDWSFTDDGKPGVNAALAQPVAVVSDGKGNIYIADPAMSTLVQLNTSGIVTIVAGNGLQRSAGDGGPARAALLNQPRGVAVDEAGNIYVSDTASNRVRKIATDGTISTFAGGNTGTFSGDGGPAVQAVLSAPMSLAADNAGNVYILDGLYRIRKVNPAGVIQTVAGTGQPGFSGDGGLAVNAMITPVFGGLAVDGQGNFYIGDSSNCRVRRVNTGGIITTVAGSGVCGSTGDGGAAVNAQINYPTGVAVDAQGNLYITELYGNHVRRVDAGGAINTVAGTGVNGFQGDGGGALQAQFSGPIAVTVDPSGNVFVADRDNQRIRAFQPGGAISTAVGSGSPEGDGGPAASAKFNNPSGLATDSAGNIYVADANNWRVRNVSASGIITTVAGTGRQGSSPDGTQALLANLQSPIAVAIDPQGRVVFAENLANRIRRVQTDGTIQTIAGGPGSFGESGDGGQAIAARIAVSNQMLYDTKGNLYFVNNYLAPNQVRVITPSGQINLFAGNGQSNFSGDGGLAQNAGIGNIVGLATDPAGNVYLADAGNERIRKVDINGVITTIAGTGTAGFAPDGTMASQAQIGLNMGMIVSGDGTLIFSANNRVRSIAADGTLKTLAGSGTSGFSGDGGLASAAAFAGPQAYVFDPQGNLMVLDRGNIRVREILAGPVPIITLSQKGLTFTAATGTTPQPQTFTVVNGALGVLNFSIAVSTASGGNWLSTSVTSGVANTNAPGVPVTVNVDPSKLSNSDYYGSITITAPGVPNSPQAITVVLHVASASALPVDVTVSPGGFIFTGVQGGAAPAAQTMTLSTLSAQSLNYGATLSFGGLPFLSLTNMTGTVVAGKAVTFTLQPVINSLAAGVYNANITIAAGSAPIKEVSIFLIVAPQGSASAKGRSRSIASSCTPTKLTLVITSLSSGFMVTAAWPIAIEATVLDDCTQPLTSGSVIAKFSTTDPPLTLQSLQDGRWAATWQTQSVIAQVQITVQAVSNSGALSGTAQITGGLEANSNPPPQIASGGVLNSASYEIGSPIAPGSIVSIFGTYLASSSASATSLPLPLVLNDTQVAAAGRALPLLYISANQVNAQIPFDLAVNATQQLIVTRGTTVSSPEPISVISDQAGVFTQSGNGEGNGIIVAVYSDGSQVVVGNNNPVAPGNAIVIYATGLGNVNPPVLAGSPGPISPLSTTVDPVSVTIGAVPASVFFSGLTPGFAGLYQVNAFVPAGVPTGNNVQLVLTQNGISSAPVNIAVQGQ